VFISRSRSEEASEWQDIEAVGKSFENANTSEILEGDNIFTEKV
jgi:hypothetical protein